MVRFEIDGGRFDSQVTGTTRKLVVCIVSGNFMSTTDGKDRLEGHFSGKQYQGWKKIRSLVKELETKRLKPGTKRMTRSGGGGGRGMNPRPTSFQRTSFGGRGRGGGGHRGGGGGQITGSNRDPIKNMRTFGPR